MEAGPKVTRLEVTELEYEIKNMGTDYNGFNLVYEKGSTAKRRMAVLQIYTDQGIVGETVTSSVELSTAPIWAGYLIGKNTLERERLYSDVKRALRQVARIGVSAMDNALWDIAGKYYNSPIWRLLGGHIRPLPAYASTTHGDENGGLDSPEAYAEFAVQCKEMGYPCFKIHGWGGGRVDREIATIAAVRKAVGPGMALLIDPACELNTWGDTWTVGRACDDARFFWLEDPYKDGGISQFGHRKLRQLIRTPILQTEHVRSLEPHVDFAIAEATDFMRGDVNYDGVTGVMKLAHACEGLGIDIELHGGGPLQRHLMTSIRNTNFYEMALVHPRNEGTFAPIYKDYRDGLDVIDENGCVYAPEGPGAGVELDWEFIRKNRTGGVVYE
ncbi:MAG: hypothetical protein JW852_02100 [Spirochaetales bacterium]|nr:hypothetical protein [Spirochaetales bacterium]